MGVYKKLTKKELEEIVDNIIPRVYIDDRWHHEKFKQVFVIKNKNKIYLPFIVSTFGRVFSINYWGSGKIHEIKTAITSDGYVLVNMRYKKICYGIDLHRLIALVFIKKENKDYTDVNHIDGVKTNNYIWNLEWCTHQENITHCWNNNLHPIYVGEQSSHHKYTNEQIHMVCKLVTKNYKTKDISKLTGVSKDMLKRIINKQNWNHITDQYDFSHYTYGK